MIKEEPPMTGHDPVNKPVHYNQAGIECIDAIEAMTEYVWSLSATSS